MLSGIIFSIEEFAINDGPGIRTTVFLKGWEQTIAAYLIYVLAFYTLSVVTVFLVMVLPAFIEYEKLE